MRNRLRPQGIEAPRGAYGSGGWILEAGRWRRGKDGYPPPLVFVSVDSKGVKVICFDTLLQVLILKVVKVAVSEFLQPFARCALGKRGSVGVPPPPVFL